MIHSRLRLIIVSKYDIQIANMVVINQTNASRDHRLNMDITNQRCNLECDYADKSRGMSDAFSRKMRPGMISGTGKKQSTEKSQ